MELKQCKQCGELKQAEQFRKYYGGRKGRYTVCIACEKINSRAKYLERKGAAATEAESAELDKIYQLYSAQRDLGLRPPRTESGRHTPVAEGLDDLLNHYNEQIKALPADYTPVDVPQELRKWMTEPLTSDPEYYLDVVYEDLKRKYRPVVRVDGTTPKYDDSHKAELDIILARFDAYEDAYYES